MIEQLTERIGKWNYMKLNSFCTTKEMANELKRLLTQWEKLFATYTSDKGLIARMYKEFKKITLPKSMTP
jgi:hypothetical protein